MFRRKDEGSEAIENAWRIHDAQADWTGKVDAKASFSFGIQSFVIAAVVALIADDKLFDDFASWWIGLFLFGVCLLGLGVVWAALVVAPWLRASELESESKVDHIYFGHVRLVSPSELERRLRDDDFLPVLTRQIVRSADIAWKKHRRVQTSIALGVAGGLTLIACGLLIGMA